MSEGIDVGAEAGADFVSGAAPAGREAGASCAHAPAASASRINAQVADKPIVCWLMERVLSLDQFAELSAKPARNRRAGYGVSTPAKSSSVGRMGCPCMPFSTTLN